MSQKLSRFATQIGITLYVIKSMARNLAKRQQMASALRPPIAEPKHKTLKEIEFDLWAHELDKRVEAKVAVSKQQKLLAQPKND